MFLGSYVCLTEINKLQWRQAKGVLLSARGLTACGSRRECLLGRSHGGVWRIGVQGGAGLCNDRDAEGSNGWPLGSGGPRNRYRGMFAILFLEARSRVDNED